jgi:curved DNA-binding protein
MPQLKHPEKRGDLFVTVAAILPEKLSDKEKELVEQWRELSEG